jgi:hypothetical protein
MKGAEMTMQLKAIVIAMLLISACISGAQEGAPLPKPRESTALPVLHLTGDTRACHGRFDLTPKTLTWTSSWSRCVGRTPHLLSQDANESVFSIVPTASCKFEVVRITNISTKQSLPPGWWEASAFTTLEAFKKNPQVTQLSCNLF